MQIISLSLVFVLMYFHPAPRNYFLFKGGAIKIKFMADTKSKPKDGLSLVIGGIFILTLVFAAYRYFNKGKESNEVKDERGGVESIFKKEAGDINGEGATETKEGQALGTGGPVTTGQVWVATDYKKGDIEGHSYTVRSGDTLWEIAEAVYGSGFDWVRILDANSSSIRFLPNGSQALIVPGQVLILP